ncbi:MAG: lipopolysaccharide biosynthesis protein [Bacteroides sp.]|nr:lipopolysaccharide biosynthesis protein [Bacteroides sp.]
MAQTDDMKLRVARTVKWNAIDKIASMALYTLTGIVLARVVPKEDFGLVGAVAVFQAFAALFVDSGFSSALVQRKKVSRLDYSSVLWFNLCVAGIIYMLLFIAAPLIADCYQGDVRLIPLSRVMFLTFILNASAIVQTNRLMKRMEVKMITIANALGLAISSVVAIWMALDGYGAWALVWQAIVNAGVKSAVLWFASGWLPLMRVSWTSLRSFFKVGSGMMGGAFLNILFRNIYAFLIGNRAGMIPLSYYSQADKWSNMGISSLSAMLTQSFLPALSDYQDNPERFASSTAKMNRFTSYLLFPCVGIVVASATALFHLLFGTKWDASIILFQLLMVRGIFTVLSSVYNNYILALGRAKMIVGTELMRDIAALVAIALTWSYIAIERPDNPVYGITVLLWGQIAASFLTWGATLVIAARLSLRPWWQFITDSLPYAGVTLVAVIVMAGLPSVIHSPVLLLAAQISSGAAVYLIINSLLGSVIQREALGFIFSRFCRSGKVK